MLWRSPIIGFGWFQRSICWMACFVLNLIHGGARVRPVATALNRITNQAPPCPKNGRLKSFCNYKHFYLFLASATIKYRLERVKLRQYCKGVSWVPCSRSNPPLKLFCHLLPLKPDWGIDFDSLCDCAESDCAEIRMRFARDRSTLPLLFISSPVDRLSQLWTKRKPTAPLLQRIALLAHEAHSVLQQQLEHAVQKSDFKVANYLLKYLHVKW